MSCDLSRLAVDFGNVWCWFWPLLFKLPNYQITHLPIPTALCLRPSASTPPPITVLLQAKGEPRFDRTVTERSKSLIRVFPSSNRGQFDCLFAGYWCPVGRGSWAVFICPVTKLPIYPILLRYRRNPAICSIFIFQKSFQENRTPSGAARL
jgi:hypothetical protein